MAESRELTETELRQLAGRWGIAIDGAELSAICERVNRRLRGVAAVDALEPPAADPPDRSWRRPTAEEDPYNALVSRCELGPTAAGPLAGLTVGLKDNIAVAGVPMECGSAVMEGFVPSVDATVVDRLRAAGGTITAKCNLDEFAGGGRGRAHDGRIEHPTDPDRFPGGSSGGSAAAVLAAQVDVALGTDTGGSVRVPAALCGLVGVKPTYGLVPLDGVVENTYSLDHVGVMADGVARAAAMVDAIAGKTERDPASMAAAGHEDYRVGGCLAATETPPALEEVELVRLEESFAEADPAVAGVVADRLEQLASAGAGLEAASMPALEHVDGIKGALTYPELAQYWRDGGAALRRGGGGWPDQPAFARQTATGTGQLNAFYRGRLLAGAALLEADRGRQHSRALAVGEQLRERLGALLPDGRGALVTPTVPIVAPEHEQAESLPYGITANTRVTNLTGQPALTIPVGTSEGLPVGLQLIGHRYADCELFGIAARLERALAAV
jgi:amidase/aspartyl-tRNA(Asn)/glutamyl-tRNA(Gln) amidotransferase subunit A